MAVGETCQMPHQRHSQLTAAKPAAKMNRPLVEAEVLMPTGCCCCCCCCESAFRKAIR